MKTLTLITVGLIFIYSCTNNPTNNMQKTDSAATTDSLRNNPGLMADSANSTGARMIAENDCLSCHHINSASVGPSYDSIAQRYGNNEGNVENLAHKIIHGGQGLWTTKASMPPHDNISEQDADAMARYILSLKKQQ